MPTPRTPCSGAPTLEVLHGGFLQLLPRIELHAQIYFRHLRCPHRQAEAIANTLALAWQWYRRLAERGKDVRRFPAAFATLVARAVKSGRRVTGTEKSNDVLSPLAQQRHGFAVQYMPQSTRSNFASMHAILGQQEQDMFEERLRDNTRTLPADAAAFRIDWPGFLKTLTARDRRLACHLSLGHSAKETAERFQLTPGRVSQLRQQWCLEWYHSHQEKAPCEQRTVVAAG